MSCKHCGLVFAFLISPLLLPAQSQSPSPTGTQPPAGSDAQPVTSQQPTDSAAQPGGKHKAGKHSRAADSGDKEEKDNDSVLKAADLQNPVLWRDPGNIGSLDLYYGEGGKDGQPAAPFTFEAEDKHGTNPKFDVRDANGKKWRVKLGVEARPEVVASRLLWAMGYYVNDDYVLESADVEGLHLSRGGNLAKHGHIEQARFARKPEGQKKIGIWQWKDNPFMKTREFNGLRVMMAVMNNWDLKDVNNAVFRDKKAGQDILLVSDVGATFGTNGLSWTVARSKGNIGTFKESKFITHATDAEVNFATPKPPTARLIETGGIPETKDFAMRAGFDWIGNDVPRADARWMGSQLGQLSHQQLVDAFRAGHFPPDQIDAYVGIIESRIHELQAL
jgi:hypothetical protein